MPGSQDCLPLGLVTLFSCWCLYCICGIWLQWTSTYLNAGISPKRGGPRLQRSCRACRGGVCGQATPDGSVCALCISPAHQSLLHLHLTTWMCFPLLQLVIVLIIWPEHLHLLVDWRKISAAMMVVKQGRGRQWDCEGGALALVSLVTDEPTWHQSLL